MKRPLLLAAGAPAAAYSPLLEAVRAAGGRVGWLELGAPPSPPRGLEEAAAGGVLRAVAAGEGRVVTVKPLTGRPVLDDLVREHFRGCSLVLVRGGEELASLVPDGDGWRIERRAGRPLELATEELVAALGRPSFYRRLATPGNAPRDASDAD